MHRMYDTNRIGILWLQKRIRYRKGVCLSYSVLPSVPTRPSVKGTMPLASSSVLHSLYFLLDCEKCLYMYMLIVFSAVALLIKKTIGPQEETAILAVCMWCTWMGKKNPFPPTGSTDGLTAQCM